MSARYTIEVPNTPFFNPQENGVTIVAFTRGEHGADLVEALDAAVNDHGVLDSDFQVANILDTSRESWHVFSSATDTCVYCGTDLQGVEQPCICAECGAEVPSAEAQDHDCDERRS